MSSLAAYYWSIQNHDLERVGKMADIPNTKFINFVDAPAEIKYSKYGDGAVPLDLSITGPIDVSNFRRVSVMIGNTKAKSCNIYMGKISGPTLAGKFDIPLNHEVHTFEVVGPQMTLWLTEGPPNSNEQVKLWVYLKS